MASESGSFYQDLEDRILKIIAKIRGKRCRHWYQNIHTKVNHGRKDVNLDDLKVFIGNMVETGLLVDKGVIEKESFYLNNGGRNNGQEELAIEEEVQNYNINIPSIEKYINEKIS